MTGQTASQPGKATAWFLTLFFLGAIAWGVHRCDLAWQKSTAPPPRPSVVSENTNAKQMLLDYAQNEIAADAKYKGKLVVVHGPVLAVSGAGNGSVDIGTGVQGVDAVVACELDLGEKAKAGALRRGDLVAMEGVVYGRLSVVRVEGCVFRLLPPEPK